MANPFFFPLTWHKPLEAKGRKPTVILNKSCGKLVLLVGWKTCSDWCSHNIKKTKVYGSKLYIYNIMACLSSEFWARQAQREVVKIKKFDFSYWAWRTPWGHVLSLKTFCRNPALSWAIRYSVFQLVKFTSNFEFVCGTLFSTFWHLMVKFGYI